MNPLVHYLGVRWHNWRMATAARHLADVGTLLKEADEALKTGYASVERPVKAMMERAERMTRKAERMMRNAAFFFAQCPHCKGRADRILGKLDAMKPR